MISAQNHPPQSSGNSAFLPVFLLVLFGSMGFTSCELFKKLPERPETTRTTGGELDPIQGKRVYDPETGTYVIVEDVPTEKMDTIRWQELPESQYPPITTAGVAPPTRTGSGTNPNTGTPLGGGVEGGQLLSSYNVGILLPFLTNQYNDQTRVIPANSEWALQFYGGVQMAYDELKKKGVNLNVNVVDSRAEPSVVSNLLASDAALKADHMIIGPYRRDNVALVADAVKARGGVLVSPYSASSNISDKNSNYVQVNPTLESHCEAIMQHVYARHNPRNVVLVARNDPDEIARFAYFQQEYRRLNQLRDTARLRELVVTVQNDKVPELNLRKLLAGNDTTVFILPIFSDELFVYTFLRQLDVARTQYDPVVVYGMPQWMNYERVEVDLFEKLRVHVSSSVFIDLLDPAIQDFRGRYFDRYGTVPNDEAYVGYDVMLYFGEMLKKYGTRFQYALDAEPRTMLHSRFQFARVTLPTPAGTYTERPAIERFENKYVNILQFKNYRFQLAGK